MVAAEVHGGAAEGGGEEAVGARGAGGAETAEGEGSGGREVQGPGGHSLFTVLYMSRLMSRGQGANFGSDGGGGEGADVGFGRGKEFLRNSQKLGKFS